MPGKVREIHGKVDLGGETQSPHIRENPASQHQETYFMKDNTTFLQNPNVNYLLLGLNLMLLIGYSYEDTS